MTYTTEEDIEAMAEAIGHAYASTSNPKVLAEAALAASPVHAELARVKAENERLREALLWYLGDDSEGYRQWMRRMVNDMGEKAQQALQQKGGE